MVWDVAMVWRNGGEKNESAQHGGRCWLGLEWLEFGQRHGAHEVSSVWLAVTLLLLLWLSLWLD